MQEILDRCALEEKLDTETGEITLTEEEFQLVEEGKYYGSSPVLPGPGYEPNGHDISQYIDRMGDIIAKKLEQAKRYREQAERRAAPLEKSAEWLLQQITPLVRELAEQKLLKKADGTYKSKTLNLPSVSFSFTKSGGPSIFDEKLAIAWCGERGLDQFLETSLKTKELMASLKTNDAFDEVPFVVNHKVDEFAKVKVKLD